MSNSQTPSTTILYKWSPAQIAAMNAEQAQAVINFHAANPPTMDYMVEFTRSMTEISLAEARLVELEAQS